MNINGHDIRGVIFDIDGTLIDSMPIWDELGARYLRHRGITPAPDLGAILFPMTIDEGVRYLRRTFHLNEEEDEIRSGLMDELVSFYKNEVQLKPGVREALDTFRQARMPMILASIGDRELENAALTRLGIRDYFQDIMFCEDYGTSKRESKIYLICADKLGLWPENIIVFEDVLQAVRAAKCAGFYTAAVYDAASRKDAEEMKKEADLYVSSFKEFCKGIADCFPRAKKYISGTPDALPDFGAG